MMMKVMLSMKLMIMILFDFDYHIYYVIIVIIIIIGHSNDNSSIIETSNSKTSSVSNVMLHQQSKVTITHHNSAQTNVR